MDYITVIKKLQKDIKNKDERIKCVSEERDLLRDFVIEVSKSNNLDEAKRARKVLNKSFK